MMMEYHEYSEEDQLEMALTYERVIKVISEKPEKRKDFEVQNLLSWFRKKSDLFLNLKTELLFDIIKNLQFVTKEKDDVIIQQGDVGDCMYILLRGQVTIFIQYTTKPVHQTISEPVQKTSSSRRQSSKVNAPAKSPQGQDITGTPESLGEIGIRKLLGTYVCSLGQGSTFGEVSLISEDSVRTASIIADEHIDLIVVGRKLYNRSVKYVLQKEFQDKAQFIGSSSLFRSWAPRYKKQLAMALQKDIWEYEGVIAKQGAPVTAIHFILSGEVKVIMDANLHKSQYERLKGFNKLPIKRKQSLKCKSDDSLDELAKLRLRRKHSKKILLEVCLLGINECIGDTEVLMDLNTYMQTIVCTQKTEVLTLELKHYDRLLAKRNPKTVNLLKEHLEVSEYNYHRRRQVLVRQVAKMQKPMEIRKLNYNFLPARGALIDIYGPGTVFHRIRLREQNKALRAGRSQKKSSNLRSRTASPQKKTSTTLSLYQNRPVAEIEVTRTLKVDRETSDPVLARLEQRIACWLNRGLGPQAKTTRVVPLQRSRTAEVSPSVYREN